MVQNDERSRGAGQTSRLRSTAAASPAKTQRKQTFATETDGEQGAPSKRPRLTIDSGESRGAEGEGTDALREREGARATTASEKSGADPPGSLSARTLSTVAAASSASAGSGAQKKSRAGRAAR